MFTVIIPWLNKSRCYLIEFISQIGKFWDWEVQTQKPTITMVSILTYERMS